MRPITLTPAAVEAIKLAMEERDDGLRVAIVGGGCSGYSYRLELEKLADRDEEDLQLEFDGLAVWVDPHSAILLEGINIDYVVTFQSSGFVFENPKAKTTCGCGSSFSY